MLGNVVSLMHQYNSLPKGVINSTSLHGFKQRVKRHILDQWVN